MIFQLQFKAISVSLDWFKETAKTNNINGYKVLVLPNKLKLLLDSLLNKEEALIRARGRFKGNKIGWL